MRVTFDQPDARRLAYTVVLGQAAVTVAVALASWAVAGLKASESALLGGGVGVASNLAMALLGFTRSSGTDAYKALHAFFIGEAAKIATVIVLFTMILRTLKVSPLAMFVGYLATFGIYWVALARALPTPGDAPAERV